SLAVVSAASFFRSTATTFAPSRANSRQVALPMPEPPPVINATLSLNRMSGHLEIAPPLPIGHGVIELPLLGAEKVQIVIDHVLAEGAAREGALGQRVNRLIERA